jgi:hypothetical protein
VSAAAELAIVTAQRDALAMVVMRAWDKARDNYEIDAESFQEWMLAAGLLEERPATKAQAEQCECEVGDPVLGLTDFAKAALAGIRP